MQNIFEYPDTVTLIDAVNNFKPPATYLADTFFSQKMPVAKTSWVGLEYKKGKRVLSPYIVKGAKGKIINRDRADAKFYSAPMTGGRRIITVKEAEMRQFGEQPIFSQLTPQDRAAQMVAEDLRELTDIIYNRRNKMAADILLGNVLKISGYADDGEIILEDEIDFGFTNIKTPATLWSSTSADIYKDLQDYSEQIAEDTGAFPTMLLCGKGVENYLLNNKQIKDWLLISNNKNLTLASLQPKYLAPQVRYLGTIPALNLEIYSYLESYFDTDTNTVQKFIPDNTAILISPAMGKQIFGAISLVDKNAGWQTYAAEIVPKYSINEEDNITSLSVYSRCILAPNDIDSWITIKTCG